MNAQPSPYSVSRERQAQIKKALDRLRDEQRRERSAFAASDPYRSPADQLNAELDEHYGYTTARHKAYLAKKAEIARVGLPKAPPDPASRARDYTPILRRLGLNRDSQTRLQQTLTRAKPGDVVRLGDGSELRLGQNGSVQVHRSSAAVKSQRVRSLDVPLNWGITGVTATGTPKRTN
jgi:hypothetical protein